MSLVIPTLEVMTDKGPVVINECDFDPKIHKVKPEEKPKKGAK